MEKPAGVKQFRGTIDGLFAANIGLPKLKEHKLETRALFVEAFDSVPREA